MDTTAPDAPQGELCPVCGTPLLTGTVDLAETPGETVDLDVSRAELVPGRMVQQSVCPTPGCPGPQDGAQV